MDITEQTHKLKQLQSSLRQQALKELAAFDSQRGFNWMQKEKINRRLKGDINAINHCLAMLQENPADENIQEVITEMQLRFPQLKARG